MDVVIIRENEEDLYAGIEHRQTDQTFQCLKLVTKKGCEKMNKEFDKELVSNLIRTVNVMFEQNSRHYLIKLLERATRKKVTKLNNNAMYIDRGYCPKCDLICDLRNKFCPNCGQALDWSDEKVVKK